MFKAIVQADVLSAAVSAASVLVDECKIELDQDGVKIAAMEAATAAAVDIQLSEEAFESYSADNGLIGIDIIRFSDIIGMADSDQLIQLELDEETRCLLIQIGGLEYTLGLIDPNVLRERPDLNNLSLPAQVVLEGREIDQAVKATDMVSTHLTLGVDEKAEYFYVDADGDTDKIHIELTREDLISLEAGPAHSVFSTDYLKRVNKAIPRDAAVQLDIGEESPAEVKYSFAEGEGSTTFFLAPRIVA